MSDWSKEIAQRLKTQKSMKETNDAVFLEKQRLAKLHGPELWESVKAEIKAHCDDLNSDMGEQVAIIDSTSGGGRWINVSGKTPSGIRKLAASFNPDRLILHWVAEANTESYEVSVGSDNKAALYLLGSKGERLLGRPSTPQEIAQKMLSALFTGLFTDIY